MCNLKLRYGLGFLCCSLLILTCLILSWQKRRINCEEEEMYYQKSSCFSKTKLWTKANNCNEIEYNYAKILLENIKEACTQFFKGKTFAAFKNSDSVSESWTLPSLIKKNKRFWKQNDWEIFHSQKFPCCQLRKLIQSKERSSAKNLMQKFNMENNEWSTSKEIEGI